MRNGKTGFSNDRGESSPRGVEILLSDSQTHVCLLLLHFGLQNIRTVRLTDVGQLMRGLVASAASLTRFCRTSTILFAPRI